MRIVVTGATGLVGSRFCTLQKNNFEITPLSSKDIDITNKESVDLVLKKIIPEIIIHFAAKTNVDACEEDKSEDLKGLSVVSPEDVDLNSVDLSYWEGKQSAFAINAIGTKNISEYAFENGVKIIYISTDFVFFGDKEYYSEDDMPSPVDWYGMTKYYGEQFIKKINNENFIIARIAFPYGYKSEIKKDFVWRWIELLETKDKVNLLDDQIVTPTFIDDVAKGLETLITNNARGIYHVVGSSFISPFEAGKEISEKFNLTKAQIGTIHLDELYRGKARRPFQARLKNDKLVKLGFKPKTFEEGLNEIRKSLDKS